MIRNCVIMNLPVTLPVMIPVTLPVVKKKTSNMSTRKRTVTIQDVASETQERVLLVIDELGYTSNLAARSMRSHRKNLLGLVVPDIGFPYSIDVMRGVDRAIAESTFDLLLYTTGGIHKPGTASREHQYVSLLTNSLTDGVLVVASSASEFITQAPIVAVDPHIIDPKYPSVQGMNYHGALDAMTYLIDLGHRRIGFIGGRPEIMSSGRRLKGYRDALAQAGIEIDETLILPGDFSTKTGYERALELLALSSPPTAIFASNDQSAIGVLQAADKLGLRVPEDFSLIGFDNISEAGYLGLTTIDQHLSEMGYIATQMLIKLVNGEQLDSKVYKMPTKLIERKSCIPLR